MSILDYNSPKINRLINNTKNVTIINIGLENN